jgi:hypothetical protein
MLLVPEIEKAPGVERVLDVRVRKATAAERANREVVIEWVLDIGAPEPFVLPFEPPDGFIGGP